MVESWRHLQGPTTHFEVVFYSESNMQEKKKRGLIHLLFGDWIKGRAGREAGKPVKSLLVGQVREGGSLG